MQNLNIHFCYLLLMKYDLMYLFTATKGGPTRLHIIRLISLHPMNAHRISVKLNLDYKTVAHHLRILVEHRVLAVINKNAYGAIYILAPETVPYLEELGYIL